MRAKLTVTVRRSAALDDWVSEDDVLMVKGTKPVDVPGLKDEITFGGIVVLSRNEEGDLVSTTDSLLREDRWNFDQLVGKTIAEVRCSVHTHLCNHLRSGLPDDEVSDTHTVEFDLPESALDEIIHKLAGLVPLS